MAPYQYVDELVREYLLFRGFTTTLKSFDGETKAEKEKGFRADRVVDQILSLISNHDLGGLRDLWQHLSSRLFRRLDPVHTGAVGRLEAGVHKLYVVNCVQTKSNDKLKEFFEKMSPELQGQSEWKEWFALPFLPNPESNPVFSGYFTRQWQDTLLLSLHNFLAIVFSSLPPPKLADYYSSATKIKRLKEENEAMRQTLLKQNKPIPSSINSNLINPPVSGQTDVMDDFYIIASHEAAANQAATETQAKGLKGFLRNITGTSLPNSAASSITLSKSTTASKSSSKGTAAAAPSKTGSTTSSTSGASSTTSASATSGGHKPVKRVAKSVSTNMNENHFGLQQQNNAGSVSNFGTGSEVDFERQRRSGSVTSTTSRGERTAYLLLGQEEFQEHHAEVTQCKFSNSGYMIASSDVDGFVKVWTASPGPPTTLATFVSNVGVSAIDWLPNSERHFVYGTINGIVRVCDNDERKATAEISLNDLCDGGGNAEMIKQVVCSPTGNLCAIASESKEENVGGVLMLYDLKAQKPVIENSLSLGPTASTASTSVTSCVFNHNAQMIITGNSDGKVRIFDLRKRDCISSWSLTSDSRSQVLTLQMSSDETTIYGLSSEGIFSSWSFIQTSQKLFEHKLEDPYFGNRDLYPRAAWGKQFAFAGDGRHLLVCSANGGVIYEVNAASETNPEDKRLDKVLGLKGHKRHATCTDWSASTDCGPCVTAGFDGSIRISTLLSH